MGMQLTGKGSLVASSLTAIGALVCCVWATGAVGTRCRRYVGGRSDHDGATTPPLHRVDSTVPGIGIPQALPGATGLYARYTLRRSAHARATATRVLDRQRAAARPIGRAVARPAVLLKEINHAQTADRRAFRLALRGAGGSPENRHARRAEHDVRTLSDHGQEVAGEGVRRE